jgi:hypothetical protein
MKTSNYDIEIVVRTAVVGAVLGWFANTVFKTDYSPEMASAAGAVVGGLYDIASYKLKGFLRKRRGDQD